MRALRWGSRPRPAPLCQPLSAWLGPLSTWLGPLSAWLGPLSTWLGPPSAWLGPLSAWLEPLSAWRGPLSAWLGWFAQLTALPIPHRAQAAPVEQRGRDRVCAPGGHDRRLDRPGTHKRCLHLHEQCRRVGYLPHRRRLPDLRHEAQRPRGASLALGCRGQCPRLRAISDRMAESCPRLKQTPSLDTSIGGTNDLHNVTVEFVGGVLSVQFFRFADTGDTVGDLVVNLTVRFVCCGPKRGAVAHMLIMLPPFAHATSTTAVSAGHVRVAAERPAAKLDAGDPRRLHRRLSGRAGGGHDGHVLVGVAAQHAADARRAHGHLLGPFDYLLRLYVPTLETAARGW